ncbi:flagellar biosynthesis protein FlhF [Peribacillus sp. SCS-37]|uniref:flagellar biosynthesis protein FlhF n=1 Tax=Paraperibacillus esterisolvens TaxID=3115296 RepID=UPI003906A11E
MKKFEAPTMALAMKQVRDELGNDAVILNSKVIHTGGFLGLFKKRMFEVVAAIDPKPGQGAVKPKLKDKKAYKTARNITHSDKPAPIDSQRTSVTAGSEGKQEENSLLQEISQLKETVAGLSDTFDTNPLPKQVQHVAGILKKHDLDPAIRKGLSAKLVERWYKNSGSADQDAVLAWAGEEIVKIMPEPEGGGWVTKKYISLAGPTGVGKTTTLAKIASRFVVEQKKKVAFITTDTFRIGAIEQLKTYAGILGVPMEVVYNREDFMRAAERFADYDHIFIDTAGRNYKNQEYVKDLMELIDYKNNMENFLVLSLAARQSDMEKIIEQFSILHIDGFIFTKADETDSRGAVFNLAAKYQIAPAFITNGQNVPDDINEAGHQTLRNQLFGETGNE